MTATEPKVDALDAVAAAAAAERAEAKEAAAPASRKRGGAKKDDAAPKGQHGGARPGAGRKAGGTNASTKELRELEEGLAQLLTLAGTGLAIYNEIDGLAIVNGAPTLAAALTRLARENAAVKKALQGLLQSSAWGGVVMASLPIVLTIAANHNMLPPGVAGLGAMFNRRDDADGAADAPPRPVV